MMLHGPLDMFLELSILALLGALVWTGKRR